MTMGVTTLTLSHGDLERRLHARVLLLVAFLRLRQPGFILTSLNMIHCLLMYFYHRWN